MKFCAAPFLRPKKESLLPPAGALPGVLFPMLLIMVSIENIFAAGAAVLAGRQLGAGDSGGASRLPPSLGCPLSLASSCAWAASCLLIL